MNFFVGTPYRRLISAGVAGLLVGSGFPPWNLVLLGPLGLGLIYCCLKPVGVREGVRLGATFGICFYLLHTYWFVSFHTLALPGVLLILAIWYGAWAGFCRGLDLGPFGMTVAWMGVEGGLSLGFLAFPWSRVADWTLAFPGLAQPVSLVGEVGWGSAVALTGFGLGALIFHKYRRWVPVVVGVGLLLAGGIFGAYRLETVKVPRVERTVSLVQPNVESTFTRVSTPGELFDQAAKLTRKQTAGGDLVIWPESVVSPPLVEVQTKDWDPVVVNFSSATSRKQSVLQELSREGERDLIYGTRFRDPHPRKLNWLNGVVHIGKNGNPRQVYVKRIPVPFGEYVPYMGKSQTVTWLARRAGVLGYRPGNQGGPFRIQTGSKNLTLGLLVCYEDVFSGYVRGLVDGGVDVFVSVSNDSWSRSRGAHQQHFNRAIMRALETGRPVWRVGNTGISGFIDPLGRVRERRKAYTRGVVRSQPPGPLNPVPPFQRLGSFIAYIIGLLLGLAEFGERYINRTGE